MISTTPRAAASNMLVKNLQIISFTKSRFDSGCFFLVMKLVIIPMSEVNVLALENVTTNKYGKKAKTGKVNNKAINPITLNTSKILAMRCMRCMLAAVSLNFSILVSSK